ncbi:naphase-promoting complex subunit 10 [Diaporthe amygdali]|uniref:naphase-promoting complex subunit 10 n=1 Tax=Phomopsis amygdali TaxID=1214568 RepID=UPI0022FE51DD|nr:naphase-promoting complex subunit 10 [Diaporthe amygdali]KAJ0120958.1 naphase-promoting complex subunit 10 [Diaporthe amygdali]
MEEFGDPTAFEADPDVDLDEDMDQDALELGDYEADGGEEELDEHDVDDAGAGLHFDPIALGLKEINNLARCRVSTFKPGNGVKELLDDDLGQYWQSDGVQPHLMTMKFTRQVEIRALRFFVDFTQDESYTPTKILWYAGTSEHNLIQFATSTLSNPSGWQEVSITGCGGGDDSNSLCCFVLQVQVMENHQNGKDTHIRAVKVYGFDDQLRAAGATGIPAKEDEKVFKVDENKAGDEAEQELLEHLRLREIGRSFEPGDPSGIASTLDFMEDPVLR